MNLFVKSIITLSCDSAKYSIKLKEKITMKNLFFNEQTMKKNIQFALSIVKENPDKDGNIILPESVSLEDTVGLLVQMVKQPKKTFEDISKSPKTQLYWVVVSFNGLIV